MDEARGGRPGRARFVSDGAITLSVGGVFFVLAFQNGSYDTTTWTAAAVLVWWTLGLVAVDVLPGRRQTRKSPRQQHVVDVIFRPATKGCRSSLTVSVVDRH